MTTPAAAGDAPAYAAAARGDAFLFHERGAVYLICCVFEKSGIGSDVAF
jgi:hypothetical protein